MKLGWVTYRMKGNDGVSLVGRRWKEILERRGHRVVFVAGEVDGEEGIELEELHFLGNRAQVIHDAVVKQGQDMAGFVEEVAGMAERIYEKLMAIQQREGFEGLIVANCLSLPVQFAAAPAIDRFIRRSGVATVAWCPDFWWERERFVNSSAGEFFGKYFPPAENKLIKYVTINTLAQKSLRDRLGLESVVVPDTFDFEAKIDKLDKYSQFWRGDFGISGDDVVFLQATRVVPRKRIEWAIELVAKLADPRVVLVIAGEVGDEGEEYLRELENLAEKLRIRHKIIGERVNDRRGLTAGGQRIYTLWDCFVNCDWMTYPSETEGFGNQFLEGVYFRKPIFVNRYPVYVADIAPLGFECVEMAGRVTDGVVSQVRRWLADPRVVARAVEKNWKIAQRHFSYQQIGQLLAGVGL